jgi:outer membrane autotransporter protein
MFLLLQILVVLIIKVSLTFGSVVDQSNNIVGTIGAEGAALGTVTVNGVGNNVFGSAIYAQTLATGANAGTNATFNGAVNVNTLTIGAGASTVTANGAVNVKAAAGIGAGATLVVGTADGKSAAPYLQAIDGDGTVTFNSQVNALVTNTSGIGAIGANAGPALVNVNFAGDNTFSETVDATTMTLGKGANVTAKSDVTVGTLNVNTGTFTTESTSVLNAIVNFADNGKLVANKAVAGGHAITTATNNTGTVEFNDVQGAGTVGAIGAVNKALKAVSINGAGASEFDEITAQTINVGANVTTAALNGAIAAEALNIGGTAAVTADVALSVVKTGTTGAVNFTGDASLITTAAQTVAIDAITTNANETGTVTFAQGVVARNDAVNAAAHAAVGNIGAKGAALKVLNLGNGGTLAGAVFAKDINLTGADLTVTGSVTGNLATTTARTITLTGGNFTGDIKNNGGDATLVLGDKAIFTGNVGLSNALAAEVSVAADAKASMAGNVNAAAFTLNNKAELTLNGASKINTEVPGNVGAGVTVNTVAANAATINMNSNNLEVTGFVMPVNGVLNVNYGATPGKLSMTNALVGATGFNAKSTVTLSLGAKPELATAGTEYTLLDVTTTNAANFKAVGTLLDAKTKKVTLADASNDYVTLSGLTITAKANDAGYWGKATTGRQTAAAIKASGADKIATGRATTDGIFTTFATAYGNGTTGGTEDAYFAKLGRLSAAERAADFAKVSNVAPVVSAATSAVVSATEAAASAISSRVATVASGDDNRQMGAWVSGFGSMGKQGARKGDAGYKAKTAGITLGADTELSDSAVLGLAANFTNADLKLKNQLAGGKVKAKTYMVSLYGLYNISDFVISGAASVGSSKSTVNTAGTSKFSSTNFGAKATVGYKYNMSDVMLTPMAGLEFARFGKSNATETGTQRVIKIKALNKVAAILGAKVATEMSGVTPEVHAFLNYDLTNNAQKATVGLGSDATVNIATPNAKAARMSYNLGTSVSAVADDIEYGIGYDATISNKYVAHQGSIKVRLNF